MLEGAAGNVVQQVGSSMALRARRRTAAGPPGRVGLWRDRTVFITGHSGFIGAWLCMILREAGARVVGFSMSDDSASASRAAWLEELSVPAISADVRDFDALMAALEATRPDVVVHLAAQALVGRGYREPRHTFDVNVNGSLNVLEGVRRTAIPALVHVTSDKCYAPPALAAGAVAEDAPLGGTGPYPASKTIAEILFKEYSDLCQLSSTATWMTSIRLGNVVGGGDEADRLVPNCLRAFEANRPFAVRDPLALRPWQHVVDVVTGICLLAQALLQRDLPSGLSLNFAPPQCDLTAGGLVDDLAAAWSCPFPEEPVLRLDGSYASGLLGWHHRVATSALAGVTVEWGRLVAQGLSPAEAMADQLRCHQQQALTTAATA
jgi:CDP-glucose 4,6-dehydratase